VPDPVIDADGHIMEPVDLWETRLPEEYRDRGLIVNREDPHYQTISGLELPPRDKYVGREEHNKMGEVLTEERYREPVSRDFSAASAIDSMDIEGIDASVLFPSRGLFLMGVDERVDPAVTTASARVYNDWLAEYCATAPGRLFGAAMVDPRQIDQAVAETQRAVAELGHVAVFLRPNPVCRRMWHDAAYDALWAVAQELDVPICFHEAGAVPLPQVATDRFDRHGYWHVLTHPQEQQIALVSVVLGGITERFPRLRFGFLEAGAGWLPYMLWRMDEAFENERTWEFRNLTMEPSEYVRRQCFVSIDTDEEPGITTLHALDGGNVVWGSDYPHPDGKFPIAIKTLRSLPGLTGEYFSDVTYRNPARLFGPRLSGRLRPES
jgi:uncharacterized protein